MSQSRWRSFIMVSFPLPWALCGLLFPEGNLAAWCCCCFCLFPFFFQGDVGSLARKLRTTPPPPRLAPLAATSTRGWPKPSVDSNWVSEGFMLVPPPTPPAPTTAPDMCCAIRLRRCRVWICLFPPPEHVRKLRTLALVFCSRNRRAAGADPRPTW